MSSDTLKRAAGLQLSDEEDTLQVSKKSRAAGVISKKATLAAKNPATAEPVPASSSSSSVTTSKAGNKQTSGKGTPEEKAQISLAAMEAVTVAKDRAVAEAVAQAKEKKRLIGESDKLDKEAKEKKKAKKKEKKKKKKKDKKVEPKKKGSKTPTQRREVLPRTSKTKGAQVTNKKNTQIP